MCISYAKYSLSTVYVLRVKCDAISHKTENLVQRKIQSANYLQWHMKQSNTQSRGIIYTIYTNWK